MSEAPKKNTFDEILQEVSAAGLQGSIELTESANFTKATSEGGWQETSDSSETSGIGQIDKIVELKELQKGFETKGSVEENNYNYDYPGFNFSFSLKKGDKLPSFGEIKIVGSEDKLVLQHVPGEVLLIDIWATWCGPCQKPMQHNQDLLTKNAEAWKDKVRIVGVSVDDTESTVQDRIEKKKWTSIKHLTLGSWDNSHDLIKMFEVSGIPFVCLVDRSGIIDYVGHPSGAKLDTRIPELISQEPAGAAPVAAVAAAASAEATASLGEDSWVKFRGLLDKLPAPTAGLDNLSLSCSRTRTWKNGKLVVSVEPLTVSYRAEKDQAAAYDELAKKVVEGLSPSEYKIKAFVNDPEAQFNAYYNKISEILSKNGFDGKPVVKITKTLNLKQDSAWANVKSISYPNIPYPGKADFAKGEQVMKEFLEYYEEVQEWTTDPIDGLVSRYPYTFAGNKFAGIRDLKDYEDGTVKDIDIKEGITQYICFAGNNSTSADHVKHFVELIESNPGKTHLHILVFDSSKPTFLNELAAKSNPSISIYTTDHQENVDVKVTSLQAYEHTLIVDGFGTLVSCGKFDEYCNLAKVHGECQQANTGIKKLSPEFLKFLENLPNEEEFKTAQSQLKELKYRASASVSFVEEFADLELKNPTAHSAKLNVALRTADKAVVEPLLKHFQAESKITENYIATVELPEGTNCADCKAELKLPYYYFYFSKVHKCVDCAERQDKTAENKLNRYPVNEHSALIISERNVDVKRFGTNLQPTTSEECSEAGFMCNGCGGGGNDEARYICMGCRREPNPRDFVDFCFECMKKLRGTDEAAKQVIKDRNASEGHENGHALLRVQWGPEGYYKF